MELPDDQLADLLDLDARTLESVLVGMERFPEVRQVLAEIEQECKRPHPGPAVTRALVMRLGLNRVVLEAERRRRPDAASN